MRFRFMMAAGVAAVLLLPLVALAQGIVRGAQEGAAAGNRAAGPVGGAVGAGVGGVVGGIEGGVEGVLGIPQRRGSTNARDRSNRAELTANQITDDFAARTARIKADLRLTPEQEKNWSSFESATNDMGKRYADRQTAVQADRTQQNPVDVIEQLRNEAKFLSDRSDDRKTLADAAQPLYASLNDQQKRQFAKDLLGLSRWPDVN
jgi:hypothetical protein